MSLAVVFPGQGSQRTGMGSDWAHHIPAAEAYDEAGSALGFSISDLCFHGPDDKLKLTSFQQPAILTTSIAVWRTLQFKLGDSFPEVACFAGHSLGEYTALVAASAISLADAASTVHQRGKLMQEAVPEGEGKMAAVLNLPAEQIAAINNEVTKESGLVLDIANYNSPVQIVVSGSAAAVDAAMPKYTEAGARRVVELPVSAPFHSSLMKPAADGLKPALDELEFKPVSTSVIANLTVQPYPENVTQYPLLLHAQIFNSVRWSETMTYFEANGVTHLLEVGPGKVLRTLAAKGMQNVQASSLDNESDLDAVADWLAAI